MSRLPITEPGVYALTSEEYHLDPVKGGSLSSTGARMLLPPSCPAKYRYYRDHGRTDSAAFDIGRAAHAQVLGVGDEIEVIDAKDWRTKAAQAARDEARAAGKTPLLAGEAQQVREMAEALREHDDAGPLFARDGVPEQALVWQDDATGVWCRVMADWMPIVPDDERVLIIDYKTTSSAEPHQFAGSMGKFGYHQQGAFYGAGVTALGLDNGQLPVFVLVAQEKEPPYLVTVVIPDSEAIAWGRALNRRALEIYRDCDASGVWPAYTNRPANARLPGWLVRQYENDPDLHFNEFDQIGA